MTLRHLSSLLLLTISALCASAQINIERTLDSGRSALFYDDYVLAIQYFNQVIEVKPRMAEPYMLRALAKYNLDDFHGAEADATAALQRNPFLPDAWEVRAVARQNMGRHAEAVEDYRGALRQMPLNLHYLFNMAIAQSEAGMKEAADSTFTVLLREHPRYANGFVGRAQLRLARGDTLDATADLTQALKINPTSAQALVLRSMVEYNSGQYQAALDDMNEAIRLQPFQVLLRVNRAVVRHRLDDLNGALADLDFVLESDPLNQVALYNRALLRAELADNDRAVADLNRVINLNPNDMRARYNRAAILAEKRETTRALADINAVIEAYPDLESAYGLRSFIYRQAGDERRARADANRSMQLAQRPVQTSGGGTTPADELLDEPNDTRARFSTLLTIRTDSETETKQTFNSGSIHGRVQDQDVAVEIQPIYTFSYYVAGVANDNGMLDSDVYVREVADINDSRSLHFVIHVTNSLPSLTRREDIDRHFESIRSYGSALAAGNPRAIDYFGRAMDQVTVHNYDDAIADLDRAIELTPDFAPSWFLRSVARYRAMEARRGQVTEVGRNDADAEQQIIARNRMDIDRMLADLDEALRLSPRMAPAWFNRGTILLQMKDYDGAIRAFSNAIEIQPSMAAAWFNRGYARYCLGDRDEATADISRAGQLGILSGYNLLKRMGR